jgi:hypothetical protein
VAADKEVDMFGRKPTHGIAALLTVVAALTFLAGSAQAANSRRAWMTNTEYRALMLRSEALNERYGLGSGTHKPAEMSRREFRALALRSEALNRKYSLGGTHVVAASPRPAVTVAEGGFAWGDFGLGAAAMLGLVVMASGLVAGSRHLPRARISS